MINDYPVYVETARVICRLTQERSLIIIILHVSKL